MTAHFLPDVVDFDNLVAVRSDGEAYIDATEIPLFDLARLTSASSVVVALLVAWFRYGHARGKVVTFTHVPPEVMNIIEVSELDEVLPVEVAA